MSTLRINVRPRKDPNSVARKGAGSSILLLNDATTGFFTHEKGRRPRRGDATPFPVIGSRSHTLRATGYELPSLAYPQLSQPMMSACTVLELDAPSSSVTVRTIAALYPLPCAVV